MISTEELSRQISDMCPEDHLKSFLSKNCRPDGRSLEESRPILMAKNIIKTCDRNGFENQTLINFKSY